MLKRYLVTVSGSQILRVYEMHEFNSKTKNVI